MPSRDIAQLHPDLQPLAREFFARAASRKIGVILTCTYRSNAEQDELYAQGRTKPGKIVTRAKAGKSAHNFTIDGKPASKALDVVPIENKRPVWDIAHPAWAELGEIGLELGLDWGGSWKRFPDYPHFQLRG